MKFQNPYPEMTFPNTAQCILSHPDGTNRTIRAAVFQEHRTAFYYWLQWNNKRILELKKAKKRKKQPILITIDWHQDLCHPNEDALHEFSNSDITDVSLAVQFTLMKLNPSNDDHVVAAAKLNLISDVYVICKQAMGLNGWEDEEIIDFYGANHRIRKFRSFEDASDAIIVLDENELYFDIDLDYFVKDGPLNGNASDFSYYGPEEIQKMLDPKSKFMSWILDRMQGFTIATEPEHCGGLKYSNELLNIIDQLFFTPTLLMENRIDWNKSTKWKHLLDLI